MSIAGLVGKAFIVDDHFGLKILQKDRAASVMFKIKRSGQRIYDIRIKLNNSPFLILHNQEMEMVGHEGVN